MTRVQDSWMWLERTHSQLIVTTRASFLWRVHVCELSQKQRGPVNHQCKPRPMNHCSRFSVGPLGGGPGPCQDRCVPKIGLWERPPGVIHTKWLTTAGKSPIKFWDLDTKI